MIWTKKRRPRFIYSGVSTVKPNAWERPNAFITDIWYKSPGLKKTEENNQLGYVKPGVKNSLKLTHVASNTPRTIIP